MRRCDLNDWEDMVSRNPYAGDNAVLGRFTPDAALLRIRPWRSLIAIAGDWALIAAAFCAAAVWPNVFVFAGAAVVIARTQLALAVMMHEGAHGLLARRAATNDAIGQLLAAGPLWLSLRSYRAGHLEHHRAPMRPTDPVAVVFEIDRYPVPPRVLVLRLIAYACGVGYMMSVLKLAGGRHAHAMPKAMKSVWYTLWEAATMIGSNAVLFGLLAVAGHPLFYAGLWLLPAVTLLPFAGQIRAIFEHAALPAGLDQSRNARTIVKRSWQTFLFGPHGIHYHIEHHLFMRMPFYSLPIVHRELVQARLLPAGNLYDGYGAVLRDVCCNDTRADTARQSGM